MLEEESRLIPDKVKAAWKKQAEKKAEKITTTVTAFEDENKMVLTVLDLKKVTVNSLVST
jgi:hypothetical protein